jgi:hypothetical protein
LSISCVIISRSFNKLQTETVRLERQSKKRYDEEKDQMYENMMSELNSIDNRIRMYHQQIIDLQNAKDKYNNSSSESINHLDYINSKLTDLESEIIIYSKGNENQQKRLQDSHVVQRIRIMDTNENINNDIRKYRDQYHNNIDYMNEINNMTSHEISRMRSQHEDQLDQLDRKIKNDIASLDEEIVLIRDAVHTEKIKKRKFKRLIQQYTPATADK